MGKVVKQILRVYTENRRSKAPMQLHLTSFEGKCKEEMSKHSGYENWDCNFHSKNYIDVFPKEKLVYLSSESDNVIKELEQDKMYIIGGLVDHNAHKVIILSNSRSHHSFDSRIINLPSHICFFISFANKLPMYTITCRVCVITKLLNKAFITDNFRLANFLI